MAIGDRENAWTPTDCLAGRTSSASTARLQPVLFQVGIVGVRGAWVEIRLRVVVGTLVFVLDEQRDGCSEGNAMLQARLEVHEVLFRSLDNGCLVLFLRSMNGKVPEW